MYRKKVHPHRGRPKRPSYLTLFLFLSLLLCLSGFYLCHFSGYLTSSLPHCYFLFMPQAQLPAGARERGMTAKMLAFCNEYLTGEHTGKPLNALAAARYAGYYIYDGHPYMAGSKLLRNPKIRAYIDEHLNAVSMSASEVLYRFTEIARAEIGDIMTLDPTGRFLQIDAKKVLENKKFVKSFGFDANGNPKIEFHDSHAALRDIARARGMNKEGLELTGAGGGPVMLQVQFVLPGQTEPVPDPNNTPLLPAESPPVGNEEDDEWVAGE